MHPTTFPSITIPTEFARSWLLMSAADTCRYSSTTDADVSILDLEDGVVRTRRSAARRNVVEHLQGSHAWVRINASGTADYEADVTALRAAPGLQGVVLAKTELPEQVSQLASELPALPIVALIETALGVEHAFDIASAPATTRLAFGKGDYRRDTLTADDPVALSFVRGRLVNASRAARLPGPIDGPCLSGMPALEDAALVAMSAGMTGMLCIDPMDAPVVNRHFMPGPTDVTWAAMTVEKFGDNGENITEGCDLPILARAQRILMLTDVFGIAGTPASE
ncbi:CoA ester lyase [Nocardia neocaledoniensis NBRC 108232]|uniref:Citrate lyase subunit beta/citryl-CoA lyase n=1 Tax=Nocardia neocaledoniensis TaxID=236511 RepID=A0A317N6T6_9NOCA|nr:aldolase/citrate lyase family protein [Nocardia neocaledoniensis]PWV70437.1 citrate lyase subunit beta/citryl-CoA lyase [Nocardia neocaledoniensis]GEM30834.1 CoA ester lyase [Nocardia neocaledoniensis NBRC 108232]